MPQQSLTHDRRTIIRLRLYAVLMAAVLFFTITVQMRHTESLAAAQNRLRQAILIRMSEEHGELYTALSEKNAAAVLHHAEVLCSYASMIPSCGEDARAAPLISALSNTVQFYQALIRASDGDVIDDPDFWQTCCSTVSAHTAALALAMDSRAHPAYPTESELAAAERLSAFTASFRMDPLRLSDSMHIGYRFDREIPITAAQARQKLQMLIGNAASFLGNTVNDDAHGCYVFSCRNGYAEVSLCGGHLLSYAFYPRSTANTDPHALNDTDLSSLAASFLKKNAIPFKNTDIWDDRHGIRIFTAETKDGDPVTVGIRMHDGAVVLFQADAYYRRE